MRGAVGFLVVMVSSGRCPVTQSIKRTFESSRYRRQMQARLLYTVDNRVVRPDQLV